MEHWASVVERKKTSNHKVMDYTQKELPVQMEEVVHLVMEALYEARIQGRAPLFNIDAHRMLDLGAAYFQQALIDVALGRVETEIPDLCQEDEEWETEEETEIEMGEEETEERCYLDLPERPTYWAQVDEESREVEREQAERSAGYVPCC